MKTRGVYSIVNLVTQRRYIGSSVNVASRWRNHLSALCRSSHHTCALQADWSLYGRAAFAFVLLEEVPDGVPLMVREQYFLSITEHPYNTAWKAGVGPKPGFKHTAEMRARVSAAKLGKPMSAEAKEKLSAWRTGRKNPQHAAALRGRKLSIETRQKMSESRKGREVTPETREKLSKALKGRTFTPEWRAKISAAKTGSIATPEHRENVSKAMTGRVFSIEHRAKISAANRRRGKVA